MRTIKLLMDNTKYLNGDDIYYGDITRGYTSQFIVKAVARIVSKPAGSNTIIDSTSEVKAAVKKIPFGQIGATYDNIKLPSNTLIAEYVVPVEYSAVNDIKDIIVDQYNQSKDLDKLVYKSKDGSPLSFSQVKEMMSPNRDINSQIREAWAVKSSNLKAHGASAEEILSEKLKHYAVYTAPCDYSLVIDFSITHIVNNPAFKGTVCQNMSQEEYNNLAYNEGKYRKSATFKAPIVTVPLQSMEHYNFVNDWSKRFTTVGGGYAFANILHYPVITDNCELDGKPFDMSKYLEHDKRISMELSRRNNP